MWQRIQTLYLAIATTLMALMFFINKAVIADGNGQIAEEYGFTAYLPYLILIILIVLLDFLALTTFKQRVFQMRTAVLAALLTIALQAWLAVDYFTADDILIFRVGTIFPLIAAICDILAAKNIYSDQLMVESFSRLRTNKKNRKR